MCPHGLYYKTKVPTVSPGNAMIRFTSTILGLIGELTKAGKSVRDERKVE